MNESLVPPMDMDSEAAVLAAVMLDPSALDKVSHVLSPEKFYSESHRRIFEACIELSAVGQPTDIVTVSTWLKDRNRIAQVGGVSYITGLLNSVPAVANVVSYAKTVAEKFAVRKLIATCQTFSAKGYSDYGDIQIFFDEVESAIHGCTRALSSGRADTFGHIRDATRKAFEDLAKMKGQNGVTGTRTGLDALDQLTTGLHGGELTVIAGRPGQGKSALAFQVAAFIAASGKGAAGSSLEMPSKQIALRLVCAHAKVSSALARSNSMTEAHWSRVTSSSRVVAQLPFWLDDKAGASITNIRSSVRRAARECEKRKIELGVVVVDYMQLASGGSKQMKSNREQEIAEVSRTMKELAKEYDVPVLALSQLNRSCEARADKRPMLSDLRESGSIEQDADVVIFVYRDKLYDANTQKGDIAELIIAKQRQGPLATVETKFDANTTSFENIADEASYGRTWVPSQESA